MKSRIVNVRLGKRSYKIIIGEGLVGNTGKFLRPIFGGRDIAIITNPTLNSICKRILKKALAKEAFKHRTVLIPDTEKAKSEKVIARTIQDITAFDRKRSLAIVAFGGGVVGDAAGFIASIYKRGIPYAQVPTTLLAQVDSAIGGKVGIDMPAAKNLVGSFYQPSLVISDVSMLKSLPRRQIISGLAEVVKYGVISGEDLFSYLEARCDDIIGLKESALAYIVYKCSAIKSRIVERDEFDRKGVRMALNYGHTIGHAIEAACGYSKRYTHGEAIAVGMVAANDMALQMGLLERNTAGRIEGLLRRIGLPTAIRSLDLKRVYEAHLHDKKFSGATNRFVLPAGIGDCRVISGVKESVVKKALKHCHEG